MSAPDDAVVASAQPTVPNRVLDVGAVVSGSFRTLRAAPAVFLLLPLLIVVPVLVATVLVLALAGTSVATDGAARTGSAGAAVLVGVLAGLAIAYAAVRISAATTIGAYQVALGARPTLGSLWRAAGGVVWRLIALTLLVAVAVFVVIGVLGAVVTAVVAAGHEGWGVGLMLLLILLAFPVYLFLSIKLSFVVQTIAVEKAGPLQALRRSWALTGGQWWPILGRLLLLYLLGIPISLITNLAAAPTGLLDPDGNAAMGLAALPAFAIALALTFVYTAYSIVYLTIMYLDARRREEAGPVIAGWRSDGPGSYLPPGGSAAPSAYPYGTTPTPQGVSPYAAPPAPASPPAGTWPSQPGGLWSNPAASPYPAGGPAGSSDSPYPAYPTPGDDPTGSASSWNESTGSERPAPPPHRENSGGADDTQTT